MKKITLLSASVAVALAGCGSDSDSSPGGTPGGGVVVNKFIDAAVEGMYYTSSTGESGLTDVDGGYEANESSTVTFYIGGENGLKVGAASNRDVLTPFEAAGKYERAVNLAILLQSLDETSGDDILSIPTELQNPSQATLEDLSQVSLDDRDSVNTFISAMGATPVDEKTALDHMDASFGSLPRGGDATNPFAQAGTIVRYIDVTQTKSVPSDLIYVHADKMMANDLFQKTRGMTEMTFKVNSDNTVTMLAGSNDYSVSEDKGAKYLTCINQDPTYTWVEEDDSTPGTEEEGCDHNNDGVADQLRSGITTNQLFDLGSTFAYSLRDESQAYQSDLIENDLWTPFDTATVAGLNHYTPNDIFDDSENGTPDWIRETTAGSYDPITGIYTEIVKKENVDSDTNPNVDRSVNRVAYYYEVPTADAERYVDFTGTWETTEICDDGQQAVMTMVFGSNVTLSGYECSGTSGDTAPELIEEDGMSISYTDLGSIDYWWFGQTDNGRKESEATLTELNTVVRFCDSDSYTPGSPSCAAEYFVKWEYQPAGVNWDEGLLIRYKMDSTGDTNGKRPSIMQKVN